MAFLALLLFVLVSAGWTVIAHADSNRRVHGGDRWLASFCIGAMLLYFLVFFIGPLAFSVVSATAIVGALALLGIPSARPIMGELRRSLACFAKLFADRRLTVLWAAIIMSMVLMLVQAFAPPNDYDSLNYHLAIPRYDIERGFLSPFWYRGVFSFFPALSEHHVRIALILAGEGAAQGTTWLFGLFLVLGVVLLLRRLGFGASTAALAALMLISVRGVVWEMATCYVEIQLAVFILLASISYAAWREERDRIWMVLFGLALAGGVLVKYHGLIVPFCFGPIIVWDVVKGRLRIRDVAGAAALCVLLLVPHMIRNAVYAGNPLFPIMNGIFKPDAPVYFSVDDDPFGRPRTILNYLRVLWDISIVPTYHFDGAMLGAPYLLAFAPFALLGKRDKLLPMAVVFLLYLAFWHWGMTRQVRFLIPALPFLAAFAAIGAEQLWVRASRWSRPVVVMAFGILAVNQLLFIGIYALIRVPPAIGLVSAADYHAKTPTMNGAYYGACKYVDERLAPDETFISLLEPHSYYCPQSPAIIAPAFPEEAQYWQMTRKPLPTLTREDLASEMQRRNVAFVVLETNREFRFGPNSAPTVVQSDYTKGLMSRMGSVIQPALRSLQPVYEDANSAVYEGKPIIKALRGDGA